MLAIHSIKVALCKIVLFLCGFCLLASCNAQNHSQKESWITLCPHPKVSWASQCPPKEPIEFWNMILAGKLDSNWKPSKSFQNIDQNLKIVILVKISTNGTLKNMVFHQKSGNSELDNYVMKVIEKSFPLAPLPKGMDSHNLAIPFTAKGLGAQ